MIEEHVEKYERKFYELWQRNDGKKLIFLSLNVNMNERNCVNLMSWMDHRQLSLISMKHSRRIWIYIVYCCHRNSCCCRQFIPKCATHIVISIANTKFKTSANRKIGSLYLRVFCFFFLFMNKQPFHQLHSSVNPEFVRQNRIISYATWNNYYEMMALNRYYEMVFRFGQMFRENDKCFADLWLTSKQFNIGRSTVCVPCYDVSCLFCRQCAINPAFSPDYFSTQHSQPHS